MLVNNAALSEVHSSVYWKTILNMSFPSFCNGTPPGMSLPHGLPWQPQTLGPHLDPGHVLCSQKPPCFCGAGLMGRFAVNAPTSLCPVSLGGFPSRGGPVCRPACAQRGARKPATGRPAAAVGRPDRGADGQVGRRRCAPCGPRAPPSRGLSSGSASLWLHVVNVTLFRVVSANGVMALLCTRKLRKLL